MKKQALLESVAANVIGDLMLAALDALTLETVVLVALVIAVGVLLIVFMRRWESGTYRPPDDPPEEGEPKETTVEWRFSFTRRKR